MIKILLAVASLALFCIWANLMVNHGDALDERVPPWVVLSIMVILAILALEAMLYALGT